MDLRAEERGAGESRRCHVCECRPRFVDGNLQKVAHFLFHLCFEFRRRAFGHDTSGIHEGQPIAVLRFTEVVCGDKDGDAFFPGQPRQDLPEPSTADGVHAGRRFVKKQDTRAVDECTTQCQTLSHPHGEASCPIMFIAAEAGHVHDPCHPLLRLPTSQSINPGKEPDILDHGQVQIQGEGLGHVPDAFLDRTTGRPHVGAGHASFSARRRQNPGQHLDDGRLTRAVRPEEAEDFALLHVETDSIHRSKGVKIANELLGLDGQSIERLPIPRMRGMARCCRRPRLCILFFQQQCHDHIFQLRLVGVELRDR